MIILLGVGGVARSQSHAVESARLVSSMDPEYLAALTLSVYPGTPLEKQLRREKFQLQDSRGILTEMRTFVDGLFFDRLHISHQSCI